MSTNSVRTVGVTFSGDVSFNYSAQGVNPTSPGSETLVSLTTGDNTITIPTTGALATSVTIIKPNGNTVLIKLKGIAGDTGISLHKTDPDSISFDASMTTFILNAASQVNGVRLVWA